MLAAEEAKCVEDAMSAITEAVAALEEDDIDGACDIGDRLSQIMNTVELFIDKYKAVYDYVPNKGTTKQVQSKEYIDAFTQLKHEIEKLLSTIEASQSIPEE